MCAAKAEADLAAKVRWATAEAKEVARVELRGEEQICSHMAAELRERISQAEMIEDGLQSRMEVNEAQMCGGLPSRPPISPPVPSRGPSTPQLQELDEYADLVEQLRSEVAQERAAHEASASTLAALRGSYRSLLQRASTSNVIGQSEADGKVLGSMPMSWAAH